MRLDLVSEEVRHFHQAGEGGRRGAGGPVFGPGVVSQVGAGLSDASGAV